MACNYLVALQEASIQTFAQTSVRREQAMAILQPIVSDAVSKIFSIATQTALTGSIARGDVEVVDQQLGQIALTLAKQRGVNTQTAQLLAQSLHRSSTARTEP